MRVDGKLGLLVLHGVLVASAAAACASQRVVQQPAAPPMAAAPAAPASLAGMSVDVAAFGAEMDDSQDDTRALCAAITAAAAGPRQVVVVSRKLSIRSHLEEPSCKAVAAQLTYVVPRGGGFEFSKPGLRFVPQGDLVAGPYQVFFGASPRLAGTSLFSGGTTLPEWWGALGDGTTDDTSAIAQAIQASRAEVLFRPTTYLVSGPEGADLFGFQAKLLRGQRHGAVGGTIIKVSPASAILQSVFRALTHKVVLRDLKVDANGRSLHGVLLDRSHHSILENVEVAGARSHGFYSRSSMNSAWTNLVASSNGGDGFRLEDSNASRLVNATTSLNRGYGISVRSTSPEKGGASAGVTIMAPDLEGDQAGGIEFLGTTSVSALINPWIESGATGDALRLERARHVSVFGGRFTGIGNGTNRAIRIMAGSSGIGLFGVRLRSGGGDLSYDAIEAESGATSITAIDAMLMVQIPGSVAPPAPVTGAAAHRVRTDRTSHRAEVTPEGIEALRADFNALLEQLRAAGALPPAQGAR